MENYKYGIFTPFIYIYILFNGIVIVLNITSVLHYYIFLVVFILLSVFFILNRIDLFRVDFLFFNNIKLFNKIFLISVLVIMLFVFLNKNSIFDIFQFTSLLIDKYFLRVNGVDIPMYTIFFQSFATILLALSFVYIALKSWIRYIVSTVLYALFYIYSMQTAPIVTMLLIHVLIYIKLFKVSYIKIILIFYIVSVIVFFYVYFTVYGGTDEFKPDKFFIILNSIYKRVTLAGELILETYNYFDKNNLLNGASFPIFFGVIDLNIFEADRIRLPSLMMAVCYGQNYGGANTSFITDGFANFGYGFDILMIFIVAGYLYIMVHLSTIFLDKIFQQIYKLLIMIMIIDLVHVQFWSFLESLVFFLIILKILNMVERISIEKKNSISGSK